jgi:putative adhesin
MASLTTFETDQPIVLSIEMSQGAAHVLATDRTDTVVAVNPSDRDRPEDVEAAGETVVDLANGTLSIRGPGKPRGIAAPLLGWKGSGSVSVTVELPERSSLRADAGVADFRCDGRLGDVEVKTGAGDIRLDRTGALRVRTSAGHVTVEQASGRAEIVAAGDTTIGAVAGDADVKNLNGKTWIGRVGGTVSVKSANGDVTIEDAGGDVTVKTANGNIRLGQVTRGSVSVETASGGLEIGVREGTAAWIDATTKFGRVDHDLTPADDPESSAETVQVHARTSFGDVLIARSSVPHRKGDA